MSHNLGSNDDIPWEFLQQVALKHPWTNIAKIAENNRQHLPIINSLYLQNKNKPEAISALIKALAENRVHESDASAYNYDMIFFFEEHHRLVYLEGATIKYASQINWQIRQAFSEGIPEDILHKFHSSNQVKAYGKALRKEANQQILKQIEKMDSNQAAIYLKTLELDDNKPSEQKYYPLEWLNLDLVNDLAGQALDYIFGTEGP
jgi:hypothetical protein